MKRRSKPIVVDAFELIALPQREPATWPGIDLDAVAELEQPAQRVEEALGALARLDREVGPGGVADEERVPGEDEPRLVAARAVDHGEAAVLGPVARRVDAAQDDVADARSRRRPRSGRAGTRPPAGGWMLTGMPCSSASRPCPETWSACVCVSTTRTMPDAAPLRLLEERLDREGRVDDDRDPRVLVADEVRRAAEVVVDELREDHARDRSSGLRYLS